MKSQSSIKTLFSKDTPAEHAQLYFSLMDAEVHVLLQKYHPMNGKILCPNCGSVGTKILTGEEYYLESIKPDRD